MIDPISNKNRYLHKRLRSASKSHQDLKKSCKKGYYYPLQDALQQKLFRFHMTEHNKDVKIYSVEVPKKKPTFCPHELNVSNINEEN